MALDDNATGKIDLMTVLMHELGQSGLKHVSSFVDSIRLQHSIPAYVVFHIAVDLVMVESSHEPWLSAQHAHHAVNFVHLI